jgi:hypothetical protein
MLNQIVLWTAELESAGGSILDTQLVQLMVDGLSGDTFRDNFWFKCRGQMMMKGLKEFTSATAGAYISKFWYAYKTVKPSESANGVFENRFCTDCKNANRKRIMKTHNTADCRFAKNIPDSSNLTAEKVNKESS